MFSSFVGTCGCASGRFIWSHQRYRSRNSIFSRVSIAFVSGTMWPIYVTEKLGRDLTFFPLLTVHIMFFEMGTDPRISFHIILFVCFRFEAIDVMSAKLVKSLVRTSLFILTSACVIVSLIACVVPLSHVRSGSGFQRCRVNPATFETWVFGQFLSDLG